MGYTCLGRRKASVVAARFSATPIPWCRSALACGLPTTDSTFLPAFIRLFRSPRMPSPDLGWPILGDPRWTLVGIPKYIVEPIEFGFLLLGLAGSLLVVWRLQKKTPRNTPFALFRPGRSSAFCCFLASVWLMTQPMDMRATMMAG